MSSVSLLRVVVSLLVAVGILVPAVAAISQQERLSLDANWRFHLGDIPLNSFSGGQGVSLYGPDITHSGAKAGHAWGAAARGFDDSDWRSVRLPHDWTVTQPFDSQALKQQGYRQRGIGWYRRTFKLDPSDRGMNLELQFDGVATHCTVYFNGTAVAHNFCGYTSFYIDITALARYGNDENTIAVRVDANAMEGWWYEGAGIYRHTWLVKRNALHVVTDGVYANPIRSAQGRWTIPAEVTLANSGPKEASATVEVEVLDSARNRVARGSSSAMSLRPMDQAVANVMVPVKAPLLWSVAHPNLYMVRTTVYRQGKPVDSLDSTCGFRTIRFDKDKGFFLNDQPLKLQGTSNHQDHAGVGVAVPDSIVEFRIRKLKEMGSNAYRTAHNPPSRELLDACDSLGMLVMDETRQFNSSPEYLRQLEWLVGRDRNHPSVILWSLFNEEALQGNEEGMEMTRVMNAVVKKLDSTRPTTGGQNKGQLTSDGKANPKNASWTMDVLGINYQASDYDRIHAAYPNKPMVSTEDTSQVMSRGEYFTDYSRNIVGSYDDVYPGWDEHSSARNSWEAIAKRPFLAGGFSWTGFAYRGEPTPFGWPSASSFFGAIDLCGFPKPEFFVRQAHWVKDRPILTLAPHWNGPGRDGQPIKVMALTNADHVAIFLNGKPLGEKPVDPFQMAEWNVIYAPGRLEAIAKRAGKEVARATVETTGEPVALLLTPDRKSLAGDGRDAMPVTVAAVDSKGNAVPIAQHKVKFLIDGAGDIIGVGNGDPNSHEPEVFLPPMPRFTRLENWRWKLADVPENRKVLPEYGSTADDSRWQKLGLTDANTIEKEHTSAIYRTQVTLTEEELQSLQIRLRIAGCDDDGWYFVNGQFVGESHDWSATAVFDVKKHLHVGENTIAVGVKNTWGGGGLKPGSRLEFLASPTALEWTRSLYNGLAQVIVQSAEKSGEIKLTAIANGLAPASVVIKVLPSKSKPLLP